MNLLFTCEHGGHQIPKEFAALFRNERELLHSHRGWDEYALAIAKAFSKQLRAPLLYSETSRLVVDLNRSPGHPKIFSEITKLLPPDTKSEILKRYYEPYRRRAKPMAANKIHLSIHSFTPVLFGVRRKNDIGILFDPKRPLEKKLATQLRQELRARFPKTKIFFNLPYRGTNDGHTTHLRTCFPDRNYAGLEIEFNQAWVAKQIRAKTLKKSVALFADAIGELHA